MITWRCCCFYRDYLLLKLKLAESVTFQDDVCKHYLYMNLGKLFPFLRSLRNTGGFTLKEVRGQLSQRHLKLHR